MYTAKTIITLLSACLTPTVALMGILITYRTHKLAIRKRKDDLFDRRYKFYKDFERLWKTTGPENEGAKRIWLEWDDIEPFAQEAYFLFGQDIAEHLRSYEGKRFDQVLPWVPDPELVRPFEKYLCFEEE